MAKHSIQSKNTTGSRRPLLLAASSLQTFTASNAALLLSSFIQPKKGSYTKQHSTLPPKKIVTHPGPPT